MNGGLEGVDDCYIMTCLTDTARTISFSHIQSMIDTLNSDINANDPLVHAKNRWTKKSQDSSTKRDKSFGIPSKKIRLKPTSLEISINCYLNKIRTIAKNKEAIVKYIQREEQVTSAYG